jgi:peptide/nickel transport system substrate-binding protein
MKKSIGVLLVLLFCLAFMLGCGGKKTETTEVSGVFTWALSLEPASIDPAYSYDIVGNLVPIQITESLLYFGEGDQLQNGLCSSWEEVDGTTYVYNVRNNVTFSDGSPMTMEDVLFSLERHKDPKVASYLTWMYDGVESISKTGDWQFTVKLRAPDATWKYYFATTAGHVVNKAFVEKNGENFGSAEAGLLGTGPYKLTKWDVGSQIVLDYNENYWNKSREGEPDFKRIVFPFIPEDTTRVMAVTSGQVDLISATPIEMLDSVKSSNAVRLVKVPSNGLYYFVFNTKKPPFDDPHVRRAISYTLDIKTLQNNIIKDLGEPTNYLVVPESICTFEKETWLSYQARHANDYDYNLDKAKAELALSKYPNGFTCAITTNESSIFNSIALALQQGMAQIGITANIQKLENQEWLSLAFGSGADENGVRAYDICFFDWNPDYPDPAADYTALLLSSNDTDGGSNTSGYNNPSFDALVYAQAATTDLKERTRLMLEMQDMLLNDMPIYVWTHHNVLFTANNRIESGPDILTGTYFWNAMVKNFKLKK